MGRAKGYKEITELLRKHALAHDVAVTNVSVPSSCAQGDTIPVIVSVANQGNHDESFVVTLTDGTNRREIGTKSVTLSAAGGADLVFDSPVPGKQDFGWPPACGDVNGDGYDDLLAPASLWDNGAHQGRAYLYYGGPNMDTIPDKTFTGEKTGDYFGNGAAIGDVNGDGYADVIVAAPPTLVVPMMAAFTHTLLCLHILWRPGHG